MKVEVLTAKILDNNPNMDRYQLAIAVAKRTDELLNGATSKLNVSKKIKVADLALMEIAEGLIIIKGFVDIKK
ncbi:MAG: DNA-directed RNA polymerase subunit omega [Sulfurimonas sp.]|jgi:DNA-directed RNA polymerase subunit omega|uniref:DNA-directed RNA polymerase subunit omega n=1 Tax=unclassified Sulfurimonas TaxID=2623549 RepID=UPI0008B002C6|nr:MULTISPECIES: DNA-directed RNA polymerase subunit omega [unclassified Sulfurimonas]OHD96969.1 MAG: DNA-directed RNA polymerase subunit omega [Sulfurimonas sp. RIFCSPHIGHO2_12_FULL_36_9]OHD99583.1 MAG: DNA-directed RNA polymerase subunit omega [Sulfurimonas sp. RIFCSPLOWO2_02_FULL_36_28]OHE01743.1 MAG: DNA-directed RNA polymerase subunit omega [Sulfurimonas sp. RIFCSPLOWO2_12_FULL_36_74]MDO9267029.1 DNA-directed RNA polymerase subunit omega [Sulfurimonas sp.]OHE01071.1 MAG: DNA-directed RNA 